MEFEKFNRNKEYLICIDSDGTAMDTMTIKHKKILGPCIVEEWNLETWKDVIIRRWDMLNLYTSTRGINRFLGLLNALIEIDKNEMKIEGFNDYRTWCGQEKILSNYTLQLEYERTGSICLGKVLHWSNTVNKRIECLNMEQKKPFAEFRTSLEMAAEVSDIVVVSSANREAILAEWKHYNLLEYVNAVCAQDTGTKSHCIETLKNKGYRENHILVCGDAIGDMEAAEEKGVLFYPICWGYENESWIKFQEEGLLKFMSDSYAGYYQACKKNEFIKRLT